MLALFRNGPSRNRSPLRASLSKRLGDKLERVRERYGCGNKELHNVKASATFLGKPSKSLMPLSGLAPPTELSER